MAQYDGKITLYTDVDTGGIKSSQADIRKAADKIGDGFKNVGNTIVKALSVGDAKTAQLAFGLKKATAEVEKQSLKVEELKAHLAGLESGEIKVKDSGVSKLQSDFDKTNATIQKTQAEINQLYMQLDQLQANAFKAPDTGEIALTGKEQAEFAKLNAKLDELEPRLEANKQKATEMGNALKNAAGSSTQAAIDKTKAKLSDAEIKLQGVQVKADVAGQKLKAGVGGSASAISQAGNGLGKMGTKLFQLAKGALVFSLITKGFMMLRQGVGSALMSNEAFRKSIYRLQAAFWVAFAPIYNYVLPALTALINGLAKVIMMIVQVYSTLTGKSMSALTENGKALQQQTDAYKDVSSGGKKAAKGMKKATDEAKKQIAAFDELNILSEDKAAADSGTGDSGGGVGGAGVASAFDGLGEYDATPITKTLQLIMLAAGAALVAVGLILLFSGNIGWGIGFIIAGAAILGAALSQTNVYDPSPEATEKLTNIMKVAGISLAAIGIILLFLGQIPWGLGFIFVGASVWAVAEQQSTLTDPTVSPKDKLAALGQAVGLALVAVGIILMFCGLVPLGLGFIVGGYKMYKVSEQQLQEDGITTKVDEFLNKNRNLLVGSALAMLAIGLVLIVFGIINPITIGLLAGGVAILKTTATATTGGDIGKLIAEWWGDVLKWFKEGWQKIVAWWNNTAIVNWWNNDIAPWFTRERWIKLWDDVALWFKDGWKSVVDWWKVSALAVWWRDNVSPWFTRETWIELWDKVVLWFKDGWKNIVDWWDKSAIVTWFKSDGSIGKWFTWDAWKQLWEDCKAHFNTGFTTVKDWIDTNTFVAWFKSDGIIGQWFTWDKWTSLFDGLKTQFNTGWTTVKDWLDTDTFSKWFKSDGIIGQWFTWDKWKLLFEDMKESFKTGFKNAINAGIEIVNRGIRAINEKLKFSWDAVVVAGKQILPAGEISIGKIPQIPALAQGTVVPQNREFLAMLGDNKNEPEIVSPLSTMEQAVENVISRMGATGNQTVVLEIDGREFGRAVVKLGNQETRRVGTKLVYG